MVIKYDDIVHHLDEFEVVDKREKDKSDNDSSSTSQSSSPSNSKMSEKKENNTIETQDIQQPQEAVSERERIYQRGPEGLKQIKKDRLEKWLDSSDGVGAQTRQRIMMVFERNDSVHKNPHVLYNLMDDELSASASYLNTMVQDIFAPEEEHSDLLTNQGYTPWFNRGGANQSNQMQAQGGPMNATGSNRFDPGQSEQQQQQRKDDRQNQPQRGGETQDDSISKKEAEMMMAQAMSEADSQNERTALLSGLSDATDQALQEMATNVGGLAGTVQKVVDEALVSYARENPEWVIENMSVLQKVLGATEDMANSPNSDAEQSQENQKVDDAINSLTSHQENNDTHSKKSSKDTSPTGVDNLNPPTSDTSSSEKVLEDESADAEKNPDIDEDLVGESDFDPQFDTDNFKANGNDLNEEEDKTTDSSFETATQEKEEVKNESANDSDEDGSQDSGFDDIFGDMME
jgi:hypothetical protein